MTSLAAALADRSKLGTFEDVEVTRTAVAVTNAGDGLSAALAIEPEALPLGAKVFVVLECQVQQVKFVPVDKSEPRDGVSRIHVLRAGRATLMEHEDIVAALDEQSDRILRAQEQAEGIQRLETATRPDDDPEWDR